MVKMKRIANLFRSHRAAILSLFLVVGILVAVSVPVFAGGPPLRRPSQQRPSQQRYSQERYLECTEVNGSVFYYENGFVKAQERPAKVGDRISRPGQGIRTGGNSSATLTSDRGIGTSTVAGNSNLEIKNLGTSRNGATTTQLRINRGQVRSKVRSFTNPQSNFTIQTPTGVAGVRGTEFLVVVLPNGETQIITIEGVVAASGGSENQPVTQEVSAGYSTVIEPGNPPTTPSLVNGNVLLSVELLPPDTGQVRVSGVVSRINSVFLNGQPLDVAPTGEFETVVPLPPSGTLRLVVRTPLGQEQVYQLKAP